MNRLFFLLIIKGLICISLYSQDIPSIDLNGEWKFRKAGSKEWMRAMVPGCVHLDLLRNGIIKDPFYQDHETSLQWISDIGWEYQKEFLIEEKAFKARHLELVCKGLDTYANVYLNDSLVVVADNMFREWIRDVKPLLVIGKNIIRIQFPSVVRENKNRYEKLAYKLPGDERTVCRKAAYHFGWDFGPTLITTGIWKPIYLRSWTHVDLRGVQFLQKDLNDSLAALRAEFTIVSDLADSARLKISMEDGRIIRKAVLLRKGINYLSLDFEISNPRRWWPNGLGEAYLYSLHYETEFAGRIIGSGIKRIGLRTLALVEEADTNGESFFFQVNGQNVFVKGANYIPQDVFPTRVSDSNYHRIIEDVRSANMNMLRVWGGGFYEKDIFYDLCDENGIMVWQDFMFANAMPPPEKEFNRNVVAELAENILRLRNHPCLVMWCGNNEIEEGWNNWGWQKQYQYSSKDSAELYLAYQYLFHRLIPNLLSRFDSLRPYHPSSPSIGWGNPESLTRGDSHYWGVWWGKEPFSYYEKKTGRFVSEYGFQSFPELSSIKRFSLAEDLHLDSPVMKSHQKNLSGFETIAEYLQRDFKQPKDFQSYILVSQLLQAQGIQFAIEAHRRAKPYCMGSLVWQFNDCWPGITWSAIDYYGKKKALYFRMKDAFRKIIPTVTFEKGKLQLYVVSDDLQNRYGELDLKLLDFEGKIKMEKKIKTDIPPNSSRVYFEKLRNELVPDSDTGKLVLSAEFKTLDDSSRCLTYFASPKHLLLPTVNIQKKIEKSTGGYLITLTSDKLAKGVLLSFPFEGDFSDNYFDLLPGEIKTVTFITKKSSGNGLPSLSVSTLINTY